MTFGGTAELTPIGHALSAWVTAFDHLAKLAGDGGLDDLDAADIADLQALPFNTCLLRQGSSNALTL